MPDLGKYAEVVISAYVISVLFLIALVVASLWSGRRVRAALAEVESRTQEQSDES